jgi:hypothetical protein
MATYKTIRLGRLTLREDFTVAESLGSDGARTLQLTGRESMGSRGQRSRLQVEQRRNDILNLTDEFVAIVFTEKRNLNGFYQVASSSASITNWDDLWAIMDWTCDLIRVGVDTEIDIESRLSGANTKFNDFSGVGNRSHAPSVGAKAYWAGGTPPIYASRVGSEGEVRLYQNLAFGINPRWGIPVADYEKGRVRLIDNNALERVGTSVNLNTTNWEMSNSLVRLKPLDGSVASFELSTWVSGVWKPKQWKLAYDTGPAVTFGAPDYCTVLQNNYEAVTIRLVKSTGTVGRMMIDLTLRRGSTVIEMYIQHEFSSTFTFGLATAQAGTGSPGYISATANDADGLKYIVGSARTFTGDNVNGTISKASTATLDAIFGVSLNASGGNAPLDLYKQYLGMPAELVRGVKR